MAERWPEPVREPLPPRLLTEEDIDEVLALTIRYLDDPEDPEFDQATFGFICAVRAGLIECAEILQLARISRELNADKSSEEYAARRVARELVNAIRRWVPQGRA